MIYFYTYSSSALPLSLPSGSTPFMSLVHLDLYPSDLLLGKKQKTAI